MVFPSILCLFIYEQMLFNVSITQLVGLISQICGYYILPINILRWKHTYLAKQISLFCFELIFNTVLPFPIANLNFHQFWGSMWTSFLNVGFVMPLYLYYCTTSDMKASSSLYFLFAFVIAKHVVWNDHLLPSYVMFLFLSKLTTL